MKMIDKRMAFRSVPCLLLAALIALSCARPASGQKKVESKTSPAPRVAVDTKQSAAPYDPVLSAMSEELERSKSHVKMDNVSAPYYIEYRLSDVEEYTAEATFGA